jgi:metallo-beta-lactamase class B
MESKYRHIGKGTNPFIDPAGYKNYVYDRERAFLAELQRQKSNGR